MSHTQRLHWGILGTGNIANQFAEGVSGSRRSRVVAVGSRSRGAAEGFAEGFELRRAYSSYQGLLEDEAVEAVYISLPNSLHYEWTIKALEAGKHVLCEKPIASNAAEAKQMFDVARRQGRVLVEALMYRSHPVTRAVLERVREGAIGEVRLIRTSFCFRLKSADGNIRFDPQLAGGALMDVGCYCTDLIRLVAGAEPDQMQAGGVLHEGGIDERSAGFLRFPNGILATFACGMTVQTNNAAQICGDEGYIEIPVPWKPPVHRAQYVVGRMVPPRQEGPSQAKRPKPREVFEVDAGLPLYALEADDFARTVLDGAEPAVSREQSLGNMRVMDELRQQVGVPIDPAELALQKDG